MVHAAVHLLRWVGVQRHAHVVHGAARPRLDGGAALHMHRTNHATARKYSRKLAEHPLQPSPGPMYGAACSARTQLDSTRPSGMSLSDAGRPSTIALPENQQVAEKGPAVTLDAGAQGRLTEVKSSSGEAGAVAPLPTCTKGATWNTLPVV